MHVPLPARAARRLPLLAILPLLAWGCTAPPTDAPPMEGFQRDLAMLHNSAALEAPDTVRAGVPFTVTGYGAGSGTLLCNAPDGTTVTTEETAVRIVAYMRYPSPAMMFPCTMDYRMYPFTVSVQLSRAGTATVRFVGAGNRANGTAVADSLVKRIVVRP